LNCRGVQLTEKPTLVTGHLFFQEFPLLSLQHPIPGYKIIKGCPRITEKGFMRISKSFSTP
jgi:hypothetical protein